MKRTYEIQVLNDGPGATGYVGWTTDGIGDENQFTNRRTAERIKAAMLRDERQQSGAFRDLAGPAPKMRVVEVPA